MTNDFFILLLTTVSVGFIHTLAGPDHYLPFIALARAGNWSKMKTFIITLFCGLGHILSSLIIGFSGIALGFTINSVTSAETFRGNVAGWLMIAFGLIYTIWGIKQSLKNKSHSHHHVHSDGILHEHEHSHSSGHVHVHSDTQKKLTPWILFVVFIFGPCEPLIPLVMYPASKGNYIDSLVVAGVFGSATIVTMLVLTFFGLAGIKILPVNKLEKNMHALAGAVILICGISMKFFGL